MSYLSLAQALRYVGVSAVFSQPPRLAFVGAGGKTTAMFCLARGLLKAGYKTVLVTSTTHLGVDQARLSDRHFRIDRHYNFPSLLSEGVLLFTGQETEDGRLSGLGAKPLKGLLGLAEAKIAPLLIEADGSRLHPLKAPAEYEPVIPSFVNAVVVVVGLKGLGKPLSPDWVHRPERFQGLAGIQPGEVITSQVLAHVLTHPSGGLKDIPSGARRVLLLNQADDVDLQMRAKSIARDCLAGYHSVVVTSLSPPSLSSPPLPLVIEPNAIILLAAGASSRFGRPKQLVDWEGKPLVRHMAELALASGCGEVRVVVGAYAEQVRMALDGLSVEIIENLEFQEGQAASVRAGICGLPQTIGSALFMLVDQPQVPIELIRGLFDLHAQTLAPLTAPLCQGRRANPVLFDRVTFSDLQKLSGDVGGRALFSKSETYPVAWLPWDGELLLQDMDTEEDYRKLL
jgi:molybdenum cofactor cytidylyltransferase